MAYSKSTNTIDYFSMNRKMRIFPERRRAKILEIIRRNESASVKELSEQIGASNSTIHRDLIELKKQGFIEKSYGGAISMKSVSTTFEPDHEIASEIAREQKVAIGKMAYKQLSNGQSVIFDSSSTVFEAARYVVEKGLAITAVTNDIKIAGMLSKSSAVNLLMVGGVLRPRSNTILGEPGLSFLGDLNVDMALIGVHAVGNNKLSDTSVDVVSMKRLMTKAAKRTIILADSSKFGESAFYNICDIKDVDEIITDKGITKKQRKKLEEQEVRVFVAKS